MPQTQTRRYQHPRIECDYDIATQHILMSLVLAPAAGPRDIIYPDDVVVATAAVSKEEYDENPLLATRRLVSRLSNGLWRHEQKERDRGS